MITGRYTDWDMVKGKYPEAQSAIAQSAVSSYFICGTEDELDARIAARYTVPFNVSSVPPMIRDLATDMVFYKLTIRQESSEKIGEYIDKRIDGLIDGTIVLTGAASGANAAWISNSYYGSFGMDNPINWQIDPELIDDTINRRLP